MTHSFDGAGNPATLPANAGSEDARADSPIKDDFLALLSHELRTPLNGIMGMLQLALHARSRDSIHEYLSVALESSRHMLLLLSGIDEIVVSDTAVREAKLSVFDLESLVAPTISSFAANAKNKGLTVFCHIDPKLPKHLWGDPGRIRQILCALLANAIRHAEHGEINVLISPLAEHDPMERYGLHMLIKAAAEKMEKISGQTDFGPSYGAAAGMGLEIAIARHLVKILGGEITLSYPQGKSREIQVSLPLQARQEAKQEEEPAEAGGEEGLCPPSDAPRILVVEDEPINLKTMLLAIQLLGCAGVGADSAYKGLALLRKEKFDVVLMDILMPGLDGLEATRLIRSDTSGALNANIPIVAITAHTLQGDRERILKAGIDEYLAKPVYLEQLRSVLSKILKIPLELKSE